MRTPRELHVHIDELVLHGFDAHERYAIQDAVQAELERLLTRAPLAHFEQSVHLPKLDAGTVHVENPSPAAIGPKVAGALVTSLGKP